MCDSLYTYFLLATTTMYVCMYACSSYVYDVSGLCLQNMLYPPSVSSEGVSYIQLCMLEFVCMDTLHHAEAWDYNYALGVYLTTISYA